MFILAKTSSSSSYLRLLSHSSRIASSSSASLPPCFRYASTMSSGKKITDWADKSGEFKRQNSQFRDWISREPGAKFPPEKGRYHLYVSYACPWAHRTLITRKLKRLDDIISFSAVHWHMGEKGWRFVTPEEHESSAVPGENAIPDPVHPQYTHLRNIYFQCDPDYQGRFTVPVLYDKKQRTIVSNESSEIIRMLYYEFDDVLPSDDEQHRNLDLYPVSLRRDIDGTNDWVYDLINNGVYKSGFATTQEAYERNVRALFEALDRVEAHLRAKARPFFFGTQLTEADIRLYTTIIRFDPVYVQHFKCNMRDIRSGYPAIHRWVRWLYWKVPAFRETTQFEHIKFHYTKSHSHINPHAITPVGPLPDILPLEEEVRVVAEVKDQEKAIET